MILYHKNINRGYYIDSLNYTRRCLSDWSIIDGHKYYFYYNHIDRLDKIFFEKCIDQQHVNFLKKNKDIKIFYDFCGEPIFLKSDILKIIKTAEKWNLCEEQIIVVALDIFQEKFIKEILKKSQKKPIITVIIYNLYLDMLNYKNENSTEIIERKKFSMLCRRHRPWRTYLYSELFDHNLLNYFYFSYHGVDNFKNLTTNKIIKDVLKYCKKKLTIDFQNFLNNRPYYIDGLDYYYSCSELYMYNSDIHIVIEHAEFDERNIETIRKLDYFALVDPVSGDVCSVGPSTAFDNNSSNLLYLDSEIFEKIYQGKITLKNCKEYINHNCVNYAIQEHFISEKLYKPIATGKPFIVFSDEGYLKALKELGFSTFSPYIDESYDNEPIPKERINLIVREIKRISELESQEYNELVKNCNRISSYNKVVFEKLKKDNKLHF
jgi:hypothetical protein